MWGQQPPQVVVPQEPVSEESEKPPKDRQGRPPSERPAALRARGIDRFGLSEMDRRILRALKERGGAIGLRTLADLLGENPRAILEVHEPYLLREGWIARTRKGRVLTEKARRVVVFAPDSGGQSAPSPIPPESARGV